MTGACTNPIYYQGLGIVDTRRYMNVLVLSSSCTHATTVSAPLRGYRAVYGSRFGRVPHAGPLTVPILEHEALKSRKVTSPRVLEVARISLLALDVAQSPTYSHARAQFLDFHLKWAKYVLQ
jgi:hypothetical protein